MARIRIFAGPNGSGKSTLNNRLRDKFNLGHYINADDLFILFQKSTFLNLDSFNIVITQDELADFSASSSYLLNNDIHNITSIYISDNILINKSPNSYNVAFIAELLRSKLIENNESYSFETVFSHSSKVDLIRRANNSGYNSYLYFISTNSADINISRVNQRVAKGGHPVPEDKIISRYNRSLENLFPAIKIAHRSYIFDNSGSEIKWIAEVTPDKELETKTKEIPSWFNKAVINKL